MAVINVTPDSFSDGGKYLDPDHALRRAEEAVAEGADILDIGGESTRPGSERVSEEEEVARIVPVIESVSRRFDIPISVDTTRSKVAERAIDAGAEIINDISGLRFDPAIARLASKTGAGLILMHSRGEFAQMHDQPPVKDIFEEVTERLKQSIQLALESGVGSDRTVIDIGIGFGKTVSQNLELLANIDKIIKDFPEYPVLVGASRKSFISKIAGAADPYERLGGSIAAAALAVWKGARIIRAHDVAETLQAIRVVEAAKSLV
jgi:dihydropteroate synthase